MQFLDLVIVPDYRRSALKTDSLKFKDGGGGRVVPIKLFKGLLASATDKQGLADAEGLPLTHIYPLLERLSYIPVISCLLDRACLIFLQGTYTESAPLLDP
jgi:hypothetical protein